MAVRLVVALLVSVVLVVAVYFLREIPVFSESNPVGYVIVNLLLLPAATAPFLAALTSIRRELGSKEPAARVRPTASTSSMPVSARQVDHSEWRWTLVRAIAVVLILIGWAGVYVWLGSLASGAMPFNGVFWADDGDANDADRLTASFTPLMLLFGNPILGGLVTVIAGHDDYDFVDGAVGGWVLGFVGCIVFMLLPQYT